MKLDEQKFETSLQGTPLEKKKTKDKKRVDLYRWYPDTPNLADFSNRVWLNSDQTWINWGNDNLFPESLIWLYENSATHRGILNKKASYTAGSRLLNIEGVEDKLDSINKKQGLYNLIQKIALDYHLFGGFCLQIQFYKNRKQISDIIYQDFTQVRRGFNKVGNDDYEKGVYITQDWERRTRYKPTYHRQFGWDMLDTGSKETTFLYAYKDAPGREWYPVPQYAGGINSIYSEIESQSFIKNQFKNNFQPSGFLRMPITPSEEEQMAIREQFAQSQGSDGAGEVIVLFGEADEVIEWTPMVNTFDVAGINDAQERVQRMIVTAHELSSPTLIGLPSGPSLAGDGSTIQVAAQEFYNQTIKPAQTEIFTVINRLLSGMEIDYKVQTENNYTYITNVNEQQ